MRSPQGHGWVFAAIFAFVGVSLPFWPSYLEHRGLSPAAIGILLSLGPWLRFSINARVGRLADERFGTRRTFLGFASLMVVGTALLLGPADHITLIAATALMSIGFSPLASLADASALAHAPSRYAGMRVWGSVAFIVTSLALGAILERRALDIVAWALIGSAGIVTIAARALPADPTAPSADASVNDTSTPLPPLLGVCLVAGLLNASHAILYGFGTVHWRHVGIEESTIGMLWSLGVVAEISIFWIADTRLRHVPARTLLWIACAGGVLRWTALAFVQQPAPLAALQLLHGATFACAHLGILRRIAEIVPPARMASAVTRVSGIGGGLAMGVGSLVAGLAYERFEGASFLLATGVSALAGLALLRFRAPSASTVR